MTPLPNRSRIIKHESVELSQTGVFIFVLSTVLDVVYSEYGARV